MASESPATQQPPRIAVLFPGQGSQSVAMMQELAEVYPVVKQTFEQASDALSLDLWAICQDDNQLAQTQNTQPALLTASMAIWRILQPQLPTPVYLAGHSLGEYSALCAAGVLSLSDAVRLVHRRGELMQQAVVDMDTLMAAVLGLDDQQVINICEQVCDHKVGAVVNAANFNSPGQVVIAGNRIGVETVIEQVQTTMGKKAIPLKVSVPSHCTLMQPASEQLSVLFKQISFEVPQIAVIQNRHARVEKNSSNIQQALVEQLSQPVLWSQSMQKLADMSVDMLVECGNGNVLSNLAKRQAEPIVCYPTDKPARIDKLLEVLS